MSRFGIAVKKGGKYRLVSNASYVSKPERAARNKKKYRPGETKKGLQYYSDMSEVTECGAKQLFLNLTVYDVCANGNIPYEYNGRTYYFKNMDKYKQIVEECNKRDIVVTMQVMLNWVPGHTNLIHPSARKRGAAPYYTWNIYSTEAREEAEAIFCYLGETFGKKNRYVSNWILGNEVNSPKGWNYDGGLSEHSYVRTYAYAFRALYYAVRSQYANAHVFICTDHQWNSAQAGGYTAKSLIASFQRQLGRFQKGLKWNLAYHAYSYPLTYTNVWEGYGVTNRADTPYVTMRNLKVLTGYIRKKYGKSVRIILSEQGYSSTWGQKNQAAAIAYSYYVAACDPMVDAFIIRSYRDHPTEVAQGLRMGIKGKEAFWTFKYMDTPWGLRYTSRYLKTIHAKSWKKIVPGYKAGRLTRMYRKT